MTDVSAPARRSTPLPGQTVGAGSEPGPGAVDQGRVVRLRVPSALEVWRVVGYGLTAFGLVVVAYAVYLFGISRLE